MDETVRRLHKKYKMGVDKYSQNSAPWYKTELERNFAESLKSNGIEFHNPNLPCGICLLCGRGPSDFEKDGVSYHIECFLKNRENTNK